MSYDDALNTWGDKPDLRFDMKFIELNDIAKKDMISQSLIQQN